MASNHPSTRFVIDHFKLPSKFHIFEFTLAFLENRFSQAKDNCRPKMPWYCFCIVWWAVMSKFNNVVFVFRCLKVQTSKSKSFLFMLISKTYPNTKKKQWYKNKRLSRSHNHTWLPCHKEQWLSWIMNWIILLYLSI